MYTTKVLEALEHVNNLSEFDNNYECKAILRECDTRVREVLKKPLVVENVALMVFTFQYYLTLYYYEFNKYNKSEIDNHLVYNRCRFVEQHYIFMLELWLKRWRKMKE